MRKFLITMMCIIMVVCFMPTVAMADITVTDGVANVSNASELSEALNNGDVSTINFNASFQCNAEVKIGRKVTINGNNNTITIKHDITGNENSAGILITGSNATVKDLNVIGPNDNPGTWKNGQHAIKVYGASGVTLTNVSLSNGSEALHVGTGSNVTLSGSIVIGDNTYRGIEVNDASLNVTDAVFKNGDNTSYGEIFIWDDTPSEGSTTVTGDFVKTEQGGKAYYTKPVAQILGEKYASLEAAISAATEGQTVTLLKDIAYETNGSGLINITKSITIDGNGYSISGYGDRSGNKTTMAINNNGSTEVDVTLKDLTINNNGEGGRAVETRGNIHSLKIENCVFNCIGTGNTQVLTIGGDQSSPASISIDKSELNAGTSGYPIIAFNPMKLQITNNSLLSGYCGVYFKGVSYSEGSHGSVVNALDSAFDCPNVHNGNSNDFGVFTLEDDNVAITLTNCFINAEAQGEAAQAVLLASGRADRASGYSIGIAGDSVINGILLQSGENWTNSINKYVITGGTFSSDPTEYVPANSRYYVSREGGKYVVRYSTPTTTLPPTTPTDNVTNSGTSGTDNATTSADLSGSTSTSNGTTSATVDKTTADKIVDKAVENKSEEIVIDATANSTTVASSTTTAQVTIPTETLGAIAEKTEADVTIKTDVAEVKMDNAAATAISEQATGDTVQIVAEKVAEETDKVEFKLKVVCCMTGMPFVCGESPQGA